MSVETPAVRPRFDRSVPWPLDECVQRLEDGLNRPGEALTGQVSREYVSVEYPEADRRIWTPHMDLDMKEAEGGESTSIYVRIGPSPAVWTGYIAIQAFIGFSGLGALMYAWSKSNVGESPWGALTIFGVLVVAGALVFGAAFVGQGLSSNQVYELRTFLDRVLPGVDSD